ncbi:phosphoribosyl-AMP cyclohydrolase [Candidatus Vidania fulgoroideorum]
MIPIIVQNFKNKKVLMLGWGNNITNKITKKIGYAVFFSRKRKNIWIKGEQSTNFQIIKKILKDCDNDCYLYVVIQINNICCHKKKKTCFNDKKNF